MQGYVSVSIQEWATMQDRMFWLQCLEVAGVDNWGGIDYAYEMYNKGEEE